MTRIEVVAQSMVIVQTLSALVPTTGVALSHSFQMISTTPQPLVKLHIGLSLLSAIAVPVMLGWILVELEWPQPMLTNNDDVMAVC